MTPLQVYIWTRMDYLQGGAILMVTLGVIATIILLVGGLMGDIDEETITIIYQNNKKKIIGSLVISLFIIFFVPDKTDFATIYIVPKVTSQEFVNETLPSMYETIKKEIKELQK